MSDVVIYHIAEKVNWDRAKNTGSYSTPSLDSEGFIHCSTAGQVTATFEKYFKNKAGLILLEIDAPSIGPALRWEPSRAGEGNFPHVYGPLHKSSVLDTYELTEELLKNIQKKFG